MVMHTQLGKTFLSGEWLFEASEISQTIPIFGCKLLEAKFVVRSEFRVHALVKVHQDRVLCVDWTVERALHVSVGPKALFDVPLAPIPLRESGSAHSDVEV